MSSRAPRPELVPLDDRCVPAVLIVDPSPAPPTTAYPTIQSAIDAATAGDTVLVNPGTYEEQVRIGSDSNGWPITLYPDPVNGGNRSLTGLTVRSAVPQAAVISLPASAPAFSAVVLMEYAQGITLDGFTVRGPAKFDGQIYDGVEVNQQATATITNNLITDIGDATLNGGQYGIGVYVGAYGGGSATVTKNTISRYQKAGIVADGPQSKLTATDNTVVGVGATPLIAQIGVQISQNATGTISGNFILSNDYTGAPGNPADPTDNPVSAAGVAVYQAQQVTVSGNFVIANQTGVAVIDQSNPVLVQGNQVLASTLDGISLDLARFGSTTVVNNNVVASGRDGIHLQSASSGNTVTGNTVFSSGRHGIASVATKVYDPNTNAFLFEVAPDNNTITGNTSVGSVAFDLFAQAANGGSEINDLWDGNTFNTRNRPGLR